VKKKHLLFDEEFPGRVFLVRGIMHGVWDEYVAEKVRRKIVEVDRLPQAPPDLFEARCKRQISGEGGNLDERKN
jgi:hypothetical protein